MNKTPNYQLNQWEAGDRVLRTDFNADNAKIDAALGALTSGKGNCRIAAGTYAGTGTYGSSTPNTLDFADTLGKAPELLIVRPESSSGDGLVLIRGMTSSLYTLSTSGSGSGIVYVTWSATGVSWYNSSTDWLQYNGKNSAYYYVAIG